MNKYRQAFCVCLAGGPIMVGTMLIAGNTMSASISFGFGTIIIALVGMHLGIWSKSVSK